MDTQDSQLRQFLAVADTPCPNCGYNLRGLTGRACPECNQELTLRVGLTEPMIGSLIAAASGLLSGAGAAAVCLVLVVLFSLEEGPPTGAEFGPLVLLPAACLVTEGTLATLLLRARGRRWYRELGERARTATIALCWVLTGLAVVVFFVWVRRL